MRCLTRRGKECLAGWRLHLFNVHDCPPILIHRYSFSQSAGIVNYFTLTPYSLLPLCQLSHARKLSSDRLSFAGPPPRTLPSQREEKGQETHQMVDQGHRRSYAVTVTSVGRICQLVKEGGNRVSRMKTEGRRHFVQISFPRCILTIPLETLKATTCDFAVSLPPRPSHSGDLLNPLTLLQKLQGLWPKHERNPSNKRPPSPLKLRNKRPAPKQTPSKDTRTRKEQSNK